MEADFESKFFAPWVILPAQIGVDARWAGETSGPTALMLAVLEDAVRCIERGRRCRRFGRAKLAAEAEAWVRSDSREWPFAFGSICDMLGLDARRVIRARGRREALRRAHLLLGQEPVAAAPDAVYRHGDHMGMPIPAVVCQR